jgi:hypothetical protein
MVIKERKMVVKFSVFAIFLVSEVGRGLWKNFVVKK